MGTVGRICGSSAGTASGDKPHVGIAGDLELVAPREAQVTPATGVPRP